MRGLPFLLLLAVTVALYLLNRLLFLPAASGVLRLFLAGYFGDLLAGALILGLVNLLLALDGLGPLGLLPSTLFLLVCGAFWELIPPLYQPGSVRDWWDLPAYLAGGLLWFGASALFRRLSVKKPAASEP